MPKDEAAQQCGKYKLIPTIIVYISVFVYFPGFLENS